MNASQFKLTAVVLQLFPGRADLKKVICNSLTIPGSSENDSARLLKSFVGPKGAHIAGYCKQNIHSVLWTIILITVGV